MIGVILGSFFMIVLLLLLNFPSGFKQLMARISFQNEKVIPDYPVAAAAPLMFLLAWLVVVPGIASILGTTTFQRGVSSVALVVAAAIFVLVGLSLAVWPEKLSKKLRWPQATSSFQLFVSRLVGAAMLVGGSWLIRSVFGY